MIKFISRIFDHLIFTSLFIAGIQLPAFIQQYSQVINGKLAEASFHLQKYQEIADKFFSGNLSKLIQQYKNNNESAIEHTGQLVESTLSRVEFLQQQFNGLTQQQYLDNLYFFITQFDQQSVQLTTQNFQPAIPLSIEALTTGIILATVALVIKLIIGNVFSRIFVKRSVHQTI